MRRDRPSTTARAIALAMLWLGRQPSTRTLVPADDAALLAERLPALGIGMRCLAWLARSSLAVPLVRCLEMLLVPGIIGHFALRKRAIGWQARAAIDAGCGQLVVVAAGLDLLAWRLAQERPALGVFEVDHPATQSAKRTLFGEQVTAAQHLVLQPVDLATTRLPAALAAHRAWRSEIPTVFLVEGLTMYLLLEQVVALLSDLRALAAPGSRLIATFMEPGASGRAAFRREGPLLRALLAFGAEPMHFGLAAAEAGALLASCGWTLRQAGPPIALLPAPLPAPLPAGEGGPLVGEYVVVAERSSGREHGDSIPRSKITVSDLDCGSGPL